MSPGLVSLLIIVVATADTVLYYLVPHVLAPLAFIPMGKPFYIQLDHREREGLVEVVDGESGYRERRRERLALERLADQRIQGKRFIAWIRPSHGTIVARTKFGAGGGAGLIRTLLRFDGNQIVATTRQLPCPVSLWPAILAGIILMPKLPFMLFALGLFGVQVALPRGRLTRARDESIDHFRKMIHAARKRPRKSTLAR